MATETPAPAAAPPPPATETPAPATPPPAAPPAASAAVVPPAAPVVPQGAPAAYALTLPTGGRIIESDLPQIEALARANNWTNEEAQASLNEHATLLEAQAARYLEETKADPVLGGIHLGATQVKARAVIDRLFPEGDPLRPEFIAFLNRAGSNNQRMLLHAWVRVHNMTAEDRPPGGTGGAGGDKTLVEHLYGPKP